MKKRILCTILSLVVAISLLAGCAKGNSSSSSSATGSETSAAEKGSLKVTFITAPGGLGDRSFNDSAWAGVQRAEKELGIKASLIEPATVADFGSSIVAAVNGGANVILGVGATWTDAFDEYCAKFPEVYFGGLNCNSVADNLMVAKTADHEGSFLAGALAAMMTKTNTVGAIGGVDGDSINRFLVGYEEGAKYVKPDIKVLKSYVGSFKDPAKGKEFSLQLKNEGADIIYHVAGGTGEGLFEAVKENKDLYAIGVDSDQDYIAEGKVLTSMIKNCDVVVYDIIKRVQEGKFTPGDVVYDLANGGVSLSSMSYTKEIIGEKNIKQLDEISKKIASGEIKVTDLFKK